MVVRMPPGHICEGKAAVSLPVQGAPPKGFCSMLCSQRWQICFCMPSCVRSDASPTSILNPGLKAVTLVWPSINDGVSNMTWHGYVTAEKQEYIRDKDSLREAQCGRRG